MERAALIDLVHDRKGHRQNRCPVAGQRQFVKPAQHHAFRGLFVAQQGNGDLGLQDLVAALVGEAQGQCRPAVMRTDDRDPAEQDARRRPREAGEHQAGRHCEEQEPERGLDRDDEIGVERRRHQLPVADRRHGLDAEKERIGERTRPSIGDGAGLQQIEQREPRIGADIERDAAREEAPPRDAQREMIEVAEPRPAQADRQGLVGGLARDQPGRARLAAVGRDATQRERSVRARAPPAARRRWRLST